MSERVPEGWVYKQIQAIVKDYKGSIVDGPFGSNLKTSDYVKSGIPVLQGKNVTNDKFIWSDIRFITHEKAKELSRSSVRVGDILMVKIGSVGYSAIVDSLNDFEFAIIPANLIKIDVDDNKAITAFVHHYMTSPAGKRRIIDEASSTAQPALSLGIIKKFELPIPPLPEQKKIASILTSVDEVIENTQRQIDKLQELKKATMNELLTKGIGHTEFKDSELGRIPKSWEVKPLSEVADLKVGFAFKSTWFEEVGCRLLRGENVGYGKAVWKETKYLDDSKVSLFSEYLLSCGDIIIGMDRTFTKSGAKISRISEIDLPCLLVQRVGKFFSSALNQDFMWHILRSDLYLSQLSVQEKGMDIPHLSKREILQPLIPILPLLEQKIVSDGLSGFDEQISNLSRKLAQTQSLKKSLMQDLLTGKVRVQI